MSALRRAYSVIEVKEFDDEKREFEGIATTVGTDRYGDIVESMGAQFALPLPLLWQHQSSAPVGHVTAATPSKKNIRVKGALAKIEVPGKLKDRLDEAWQSLKLGLVRHLSVGFNPIKMEPIPESAKYGMRFLEWEWLELSLVTIPANAGASVTAIKNFDADLRRAALGIDRMRETSGVKLIVPSDPGVTGKQGGKGSRPGVPLVMK